jgi:hypothetical protein
MVIPLRSPHSFSFGRQAGPPEGVASVEQRFFQRRGEFACRAVSIMTL